MWLLPMALLLAPIAAASSGLFTNMDAQVQVPVEINLGMLGFQGDGAWQIEFSSAELHRMITQLLPSRTPKCGPSGAPMQAQYALKYNVVHITTGLARLQNAIASALRPAPVGAGGANVGHTAYEVEVSEIEEHLDMLHASYFVSREAPPPGSEPAHPAASYTILVLNPNKSDMADRQRLPRSFSYRYRYLGGAPTQLWVGGGRYLVIDLSAGPVSFGMSQALGDEGTVSAASIPILHPGLAGGAEMRQRRAQDPRAAAAHALAHAQLIAQLAALLLNAARYVFAPDVAMCAPTRHRSSHPSFKKPKLTPKRPKGLRTPSDAAVSPRLPSQVRAPCLPSQVSAPRLSSPGVNSPPSTTSSSPSSSSATTGASTRSRPARQPRSTWRSSPRRWPNQKGAGSRRPLSPPVHSG